jgi:DNA-binding NtrC family response regulator
MVLAHGGGLTVDSVPGRGSTFRVLLPVTQPTAPQSKVTSQSTWTRSGLVLLVDDTPTALETVQRILNRAGLEVLTAHSGADARELIAVRAAGLALAVLDFALPDDNAVDLLRMIDQHRPGLPVIIMSGYSREEVATELAGQPYAAFLQKPFGADDILAVLDDLAGSRLAT